MISGLGPVEPLGPQHELADFDCGKAALNQWLREYSVGNQDTDVSRTVVVCEIGSKRVVGYHSLAGSHVTRKGLPEDLAEVIPQVRYPIPVILLARLAVDRAFQRRKIGKLLLRDAVARAARVSLDIGAVALLVHALDDEAAGWYSGEGGFKPSPIDALHLYLPMSSIRESIRLARLS